MASRNPVTKQAPVKSIWPAQLLQRIMSQTKIENCAIHSSVLDPKDPNRLGVHLSSGWSALIDLHREEVTHIHCPPLDRFTSDVDFSLALDGSGDAGQRGSFHTSWWRVRRRRCCWAGNGNIFCSPSSEGSSPPPAVHVLDFSPSVRSQCRVGVEATSSHSIVVDSSLRPHAVDRIRAGYSTGTVIHWNDE